MVSLTSIVHHHHQTRNGEEIHRDGGDGRERGTNSVVWGLTTNPKRDVHSSRRDMIGSRHTQYSFVRILMCRVVLGAASSLAKVNEAENATTGANCGLLPLCTKKWAA